MADEAAFLADLSSGKFVFDLDKPAAAPASGATSPPMWAGSERKGGEGSVRGSFDFDVRPETRHPRVSIVGSIPVSLGSPSGASPPASSSQSSPLPPAKRASLNDYVSGAAKRSSLSGVGSGGTDTDILAASVPAVMWETYERQLPDASNSATSAAVAAFTARCDSVDERLRRLSEAAAEAIAKVEPPDYGDGGSGDTGGSVYSSSPRPSYTADQTLPRSRSNRLAAFRAAAIRRVTPSPTNSPTAIAHNFVATLRASAGRSSMSGSPLAYGYESSAPSPIMWGGAPVAMGRQSQGYIWPESPDASSPPGRMSVSEQIRQYGQRISS